MNEYKDFMADVTKTYAQDTKDQKNINITIHTPENHGGHGEHSQINFLDLENDRISKFRIPE